MFKTKDTGPVADAVKRHWVDTTLPPVLRPFARLARWERPIGWWLLMWPCLWSLSLASNVTGAALPNIWYAFLLFIGAVAMRGAGCTYNDIVDKDIDGKVERTRSRPIPSGQVSSRQAKIFMLLQALVGLVVLLQFNSFTVILGISSLAIVAAYPFMKRVTDWPQFVLGLAFSWGALMGWAAVFGSLSLAPLLLYCGGIVWTIGYDTIYAHQDKEDDALVGVRSTARLFGEKTRQALVILYGATALLFAGAFFVAGSGPLAFVGLVVGALHLLNQIRVLDIDNGDQCLELFKSNSTFGLILFVGLVSDGLVTYYL
ncbi:4-hydroxybenzoate octaprenyltransferase [Pseudovibrio axinellae]|uniref:4-hydroxybenzoate octaprenyltransferase n=1 Tax=Pseudovibrio axinellae TaxID=989403 RepID=A0A165YD93_9HYPH|nr:4-hydroxybenzoate octaprenyltransferase [Pseudovibrio axinellae]KZL18737.1 4-hydroxybenzoate octaprenyltransferase [Pseudovibrio axinellae]SEP94667.1 4-hydroxybenzoate polyprenyltransferase [Pseudovibrio axinellae]